MFFRNSFKDLDDFYPNLDEDTWDIDGTRLKLKLDEEFSKECIIN